MRKKILSEQEFLEKEHKLLAQKSLKRLCLKLADMDFVTTSRKQRRNVRIAWARAAEAREYVAARLQALGETP